METCGLCYTKTCLEENNSNSPIISDTYCKYLHSALTPDSISSQGSHRKFLFCQKCTESAEELIDLNTQMEFYQKQISELVFILSLEILHRRRKNADTSDIHKNSSSGMKLIEFDVSALPIGECWNISSPYPNTNIPSSSKGFHNSNPENNYAELCDPLLLNCSSTGGPNIIRVKMENAEQFLNEPQSLPFDNNTKQAIGMESDALNSSDECSQNSSSISKHNATRLIPRYPDYHFDPSHPYQCHLCYKKLSSRYKLNQHMRTHTGERPYRCQYCQKGFTVKSNLVAHERIHTGEKPFHCILCDRRFNNESNFFNHKKRHAQEEALKSSTAELQFDDISRKDTSVESDGNIGENNSDIMESSQHSSLSATGVIDSSHDFVDVSDRLMSLAQGKQNQKTSFANNEGEFYEQGSDTLILQSDNNQSSPECILLDSPPPSSICSVSTRNVNTTNRNVKMGKHKQHGDYAFDVANPFQCYLCSKTLSSRSKLSQHMRTHTGERPYSCQFCQKGFSTKTNLVAHERIHTGEKPFHCDLCDKSFNNESNFFNHKKRHAGVASFKCDLCDFSSNAKSSIASHKAHIHTTEKDFLCVQCGRDFKTLRCVEGHFKRVHSDLCFSEEYVAKKSQAT